MSEYEDHIWHKCNAPIFPRRDVNGKWTRTLGQTWRRRGANGRWEYLQDDYTFDEWVDNQW